MEDSPHVLAIILFFINYKYIYNKRVHYIYVLAIILFFINYKYIYNNVRAYIIYIYSVAPEEYDSPITEPKSVVLPITPQGKQWRKGDSNPHGRNAQQILSLLCLPFHHLAEKTPSKGKTKKYVNLVGLEPTPHSLKGYYSNQLSYRFPQL